MNDGERPSRSRRLIARQLRKAGVVEPFPDDLDRFLELVEESYDEFERHRRLTERTSRLASEELSEAISSLTSSEHLFRSLARCSPNGIIYADDQGRCIYANDRAEALFGASAAELEGLGWWRVVLPEDRIGFKPLIDTMHNGARGDVLIEHRIAQPSGNVLWVSTSVAAVEDNDDGTAAGWVAHVEDTTERKRYERELSQLAWNDSLTQLNNRYALTRELTEMCEGLREGRQLAVAVIDLDRFKLVNDTFGHEAGDQLLVAVADKLQQETRSTDLVARLGGDEFAFVSALDQKQSPADLGRRLSAIVHGPIECAGRTLHVGGSVGVAVTGQGELTPDELLRNADTAMYQAKRSAHIMWQVFDQRFRAEVTKRFQLESDVRTAIAEHEVTLAYQPIVDAGTRRVVAVEALARLELPRVGMVPPVEFIAAAEDLGLISELGEQLLERACAQLSTWRQDSPELDDLLISVNTSPLQLTDPEFPKAIERALARHALPARTLLVEITESAIVSHIDQSLQALDELRALGVSLAIDDFGTGYSSLSYLDRLPVDYLKIDKSFVQAMGVGRSNRLTATIIELSNRFGMIPIAEGVETEMQHQLLADAGCPLVQGYLLARPMAPDDERLRGMLGLRTASTPSAS